MIRLTTEHILWSVYLSTFVVLDIITTIYGIWLVNVREKNPIIEPLFYEFNPISDTITLISIKILFTLFILFISKKLPKWGQIAIIGGPPLLGIYISYNNIKVLLNAI